MWCHIKHRPPTRFLDKTGDPEFNQPSKSNQAFQSAVNRGDAGTSGQTPKENKPKNPGGFFSQEGRYFFQQNNGIKKGQAEERDCSR